MPTYYHITVDGHLGGRWSAWFDGLTVSNQPNGTTVLAGPIMDQTALHGVLVKIRDLGLSLLALQAVPPDEMNAYVGETDTPAFRDEPPS